MIKTILYAASAILLFCQVSAAQTLYRVRIRGASSTTDANGHIINGHFTEQTPVN